MARQEIYHLTVGVEVNGVEESQKKLSAMEKYTQQTEKRMKALNKITASPTAKIKDSASNAIDKINSKTKSLSRAAISPTAKLNDQATSKLNQISTTIKRLDNTNITANLRINDQTSTYLNKVHGQSDKLKNTSINPTAEVSDSNLDISKIGNKISSVGNTLSTKVTLPILGLGAAASKVGMDFDSGMSRVKAISEATGEEFKKLHDQALQLGADTAFSAKQAAEGMENLASAGFSTSEIMIAMPGMLDLAASSGEDLANSADIAASTLRGFGLAADQAGHVADVLAKNASATNAAVGDTGEAMKYIAPVAQTAGWSLESVAASIGELANSGIKGSQAGTILRATFSRLAKPSDESAKAMEAMGFSAYDAQHKMKSLSTIVKDLQNSTAKMTDEQKQNTIAQIFGEEAMSGILTLIKNGPEALDSLTQSYINSDGAAKEMAKTMQDNAKSAIEQMTGSLETAGIKIEEAFAPKITEAANYVQDLANKFSELSPEQQDFYVKMALGAAAIGPVTKLIGGLTSTIGGLITVGSKVGTLLPALFTPAGIAIAASVALIGTAVVTQSNLMNKSITTTTEELGPLERVMNELNGHLNKSKKEMVDAGLIYDDFGEGVSDSFKKGAQDASKSLLKIEMDIKKLNRNGIADESGLNTLKNYVNEVAYGSINAMKEQRSKIQSEFQKTFSLDGVTSDTEQKVLDSLGTFFETGTNKQLEIRDEIYQFASNKIKEHGKLLDEDLKVIQDKISKGKALELEYTKAQNAYDQAYAKSQFSNDASKITGIDGASELLQDRSKEHQNSLDKIDNSYQGTLKYYDSLLSNEDLSSEERDNFTKGKEDASKVRDEALKQAEKDRQSDLETIYQAYPKAKGMLNEDTGARFSDGEIKTQGIQKKIEDSHSGLSDITQSGVYALTNDTTHELDTLYVSVDEKTKKINGVLNSIGEGSIDDRTGAYSDAEKEKLMSLQDTCATTGSAIQQLVSDHAMLNTNTNEVINSSGNLVGQLQNVQTATDGTTTGIINLNGTPIQITSNASGQITNMEVFKGSVDDIPPTADVKIDSNAAQVTDEVNGTTDAVNSMQDKTITITTVFKKITQWFNETFGSGDNSISNDGMKYGAQDGSRFTGDGYATGTMNATSGIHQVAEKGFEIVFGRQNRLFSGGEKVLNHEQSKSFLQKQQNNEPFQVKQGQYQVAKPQQVQVATAGGNNVQVDIQVNSGQDVEAIIVEVTNEVGKKLKEALTNISH